MRTRRLLLVGAVVLAVVAAGSTPSSGQENPLTLDPDKGTLDGSPVDNLPPHIRLLDIQLPDGGAPMRPDWAPDGDRLIFLDAPIGDVWEHDLSTGANRNLTGAFLPGGVLRAHHLTNGDLVLCAPPDRSAADPEGDRFRGQLYVLQRPLGTRAPVALGERCWEGVAVSKQPGSTRLAWNRSSIDFTDVPEVFVEALVGESQVVTGRVVYGDDGTPSIADQRVVLDKHDVSLDTPAVEAQDFRTLDDGDDDPDDELIFSAYFHKGGQAMGVNLDTGVVTDYAPTSLFYEEAEGVDPAGRYVLVERDLTVTLFPGMLDIWRLPLDGSGDFERLTTFDHYRGFGANNPVVSPDGTTIAFSLKVEGEEGEGDGVLLFDLAAFAAGPSGPSGPSGASGPANAAARPASPASPYVNAAVQSRAAAGASNTPLAATGSTEPPLAVAGALVALAVALAQLAGRSYTRMPSPSPSTSPLIDS